MTDNTDGPKDEDQRRSIPVVSFVPGRPAPWDVEPESAVGAIGKTRATTCSLNELLDCYRNVLLSGNGQVKFPHRDGYCKIDVRQLEAGFGIRLLGFFTAHREGKQFRIKLDHATKARLIAHWTENAPADLRHTDELTRRADHMAGMGVEDLLETIIVSLRPSSRAPDFYGTLEGYPPLPNALLAHRYARAHAHAYREFEKIRLQIATHALLLLHPEISPDARVTIQTTFEVSDPEDF